MLNDFSRDLFFLNSFPLPAGRQGLDRGQVRDWRVKRL